MKLSRAGKGLVAAGVLEVACLLWSHGFAREHVALIVGGFSHGGVALTLPSVFFCGSAIAAQMAATLVVPVLLVACILQIALARAHASLPEVVIALKKGWKKQGE